MLTDNEIRKLLKRYNKTKDEKIHKRLISYVLKTEWVLTNLINRDFKPHNQDEYQEIREVLWEIRKDLELYNSTAAQHPPEDIGEYREQIKLGINKKKIDDDETK